MLFSGDPLAEVWRDSSSASRVHATPLSVPPKWGTKLGKALVKGMIRNAYWATSISYRAARIDV